MSGNSRRDGMGGADASGRQDDRTNDLHLIFSIIGKGKKELVVSPNDKLSQTMVYLSNHFNITTDKELFVVYKGVILDSNTTYSENQVVDGKTVNVVLKDRPANIVEPTPNLETQYVNDVIYDTVPDTPAKTTNFDNDTFVRNINFLLSSGFDYEEIVDSLNKFGNDPDLALQYLLDTRSKRTGGEGSCANTNYISDATNKKSNEVQKLRNLPTINDLKIQYQRDKNFESIVGTAIDMYPQYCDIITGNLDDFKSILCEPADKSNAIPLQDDIDPVSLSDMMKTWDSFPEEIQRQLREKQGIAVEYLMSFADSLSKNSNSLNDCFTLQEEGVIDRLISMFGETREKVVDAFLRNGKDYDKTANYLIDNYN